MNYIQKALFGYLKSNKGNSFTPVFLDRIFNFGTRRIKYNLTKLKNKDIGIDEESICIKYSKDRYSIYSVGFYYND